MHKPNLWAIVCLADLVFCCTVGIAGVSDERAARSAHTPNAMQTRPYQPTIVRRYQQYNQSQANCHPSRHSAIDEYGRRIHDLTAQERREIQKGHLIVANYKKYLARQAKQEVKLAVETAWRESRKITGP